MKTIRRNLALVLLLFTSIGFLPSSCSKRQASPEIEITIDVKGSIVDRSRSKNIGGLEELIEYLSMFDKGSVSLDSELKLSSKSEEAIRSAVLSSGHDLRSFIVPTSQPPGYVELQTK